MTHTVNPDADIADPGALASSTYVFPEAALKTDAHTVYKVPPVITACKQRLKNCCLADRMVTPSRRYVRQKFPTRMSIHRLSQSSPVRYFKTSFSVIARCTAR